MLTIVAMKKTLAIDAFGSVVALATAVGVRPQAIYQWPPVLTPRIADRVVAAAMRKGIDMDRLFPPPTGRRRGVVCCREARAPQSPRPMDGATGGPGKIRMKVSIGDAQREETHH